MGVGGLGALAGLLMGGGRGAVGAGALAMLGSLAYSALKKSQMQASGGPTELTPKELEKNVPLGVRLPETPQEEEELQTIAMLVIRAMVNAAKADGQIDRGEMERIVGRRARRFGPVVLTDAVVVGADPALLAVDLSGPVVEGARV